jgi:hypothetical protein
MTYEASHGRWEGRAGAPVASVPVEIRSGPTAEDVLAR